MFGAYGSIAIVSPRRSSASRWSGFCAREQAVVNAIPATTAIRLYDLFISISVDARALESAANRV
jgi:hypothetical protein